MANFGEGIVVGFILGIVFCVWLTTREWPYGLLGKAIDRLKK